MDVSLPPLAPRAVPDLRPSADIAASARANLPSPALPPTTGGVPPTSAVQGALVTRGLLEPRGVAPVGGADASTQSSVPGETDRPPRSLKPWGVPMLPDYRRDASAGPAEEEAVPGTEPEAAEARDPHSGGAARVDHVPPSIRERPPALHAALEGEAVGNPNPAGSSPDPVRGASTD